MLLITDNRAYTFNSYKVILEEINEQVYIKLRYALKTEQLTQIDRPEDLGEKILINFQY